MDWRKPNTVVFLDIETLGECENACVIQLGWVVSVIDPILEGFYEVDSGEVSFTERSNFNAGRSSSKKAVDWWTSDPYRRDILSRIRSEAQEDVRSIPGILSRVCETASKTGAFTVWTRGISFDIPILKSFYKTESGFRKMPWHFTQERDFRTIRYLRPDIYRRYTQVYDSLESSGQAHTALYDARRDTGALAEYMNTVFLES